MSPGALLAQRARDIEPFHVMVLLARAKALEAAGRDIVHLEIGEPDFATPQPVCDAGAKALARGAVFYTAALGLPQLRAAIAAFYQTRYGVTVDPARVVVTTGSSGALLLAIAALVNAGDQVLMADPGYPANRHFVRLLEGEAVGIPVGPDSHYQLTPELVEHHWGSRTKAVLVATPSNPTGTLIAHAQLQAMAAFTKARGGALIVDEIYHGLVYDGDTHTAANAGDNVFVINSFSKYFNMTGWRLGWMIAPEAYVPQLDKLAQNIFLSPPTVSQLAALAAFEPETLAICERRREAFRSRRDYLVPALRELGFGIPQMPQGAFYVYADCSRLTDDSYAFALDVLERAGVAITPGVDFGAHLAREHVRFAYTRPVARLQEGVNRLANYLG
ncbi:MAG: pyridoxal phosphate-dependent aminotransferase [Betaproteobacteria bacterium]|nr:pyridoxal phosphate-dependent aminotransferase [Betaproteobacteria bacterium]